jgi:hypothetical protein
MLTLLTYLLCHPTEIVKRLLLDAKLLLPLLILPIILLIFCLIAFFDDIAPWITNSDPLGKFRCRQESSRLRSGNGLKADVGLWGWNVDNSCCIGCPMMKPGDRPWSVLTLSKVKPEDMFVVQIPLCSSIRRILALHFPQVV